MKKSVIVFCIVCLLFTSCEVKENQDYIPMLRGVEESWIPIMEPMKRYQCSVSGTNVVAAIYNDFGLMNHQIMFIDENNDIVGTVGRITTSTVSTFKGTETLCIVINGIKHQIN